MGAVALIVIVFVVVTSPVWVGVLIYNAAGPAGAVPYSVFCVLLILYVIGVLINRKAKAATAREDESAWLADVRRRQAVINRKNEAEALRRQGELEAEIARHTEAEAAIARQLPPPRLIKNAREAEVYARDVLDSLGFQGVRVTQYTRDGGVDVRGEEVVAQVKMEVTKTPADRLQALNGIAVHEGKSAAFFSLAGYTVAALTWGEAAGVALFEFEYDGSVGAKSGTARDWLARIPVATRVRVATVTPAPTRPIAVPAFTQGSRGEHDRHPVERPLREARPCAMPACDYVGPVGTCPMHDLNA